MTTPRRGTTHPEMEYLRLVAFPLVAIAAPANGNISPCPYTYFHPLSPRVRKVSFAKPQNFIYPSVDRSLALS